MPDPSTFADDIAGTLAGIYGDAAKDAVKDVKAAALKLFASQYGEIMTRANEALKNNTDDESEGGDA